MKGLVTVTKVFKDGTREQVCVDSPNIATQGFALDMVNMMTAGANKTIEDYKFGYFQVGTSSYYDVVNYDGNGWVNDLPASIQRNFSRLHSPIATAADYGENTNLEVVTRKKVVFKEDFVPIEDLEYEEESDIFIKLDENNGYRLLPKDTDRGIIIKLTLDYGALVGQSLREFGLFTKNPTGVASEDKPILSCYKSLNVPIEKTDEFMVEVDWVIQFEGTLFQQEWISKTIAFYPPVNYRISNRVGPQQVGYMETGETKEIIIETFTPTIEDAYLHYKFYQDGELDWYDFAVSGTHWCIVDASGNPTSEFDSPLFLPQGSTQVKFYLSAIDTGKFFGQKDVVFELTEYTGRDKEIDFKDRIRSPNTVYRIRSTRQAPDLGFSSATYTTAGSELSGAISSNGPVDETIAFLEVSTNATSYNLGYRESGEMVYSGPFTDTIKHHKIPFSGSPIQLFSVSAGSIGDFNIDLVNTPSGEPAYNRVTYNMDMRTTFQRISTTSGTGMPPWLNYLDISANREDIRLGLNDSNIDGIGGPWTQETAMWGTPMLEGWPSPTLQTTYDLYPYQPADGVILRNFPYDTQPDGLDPAFFSYNPQESYVWPNNKPANNPADFVAAGGKRRPGQYDWITDDLGRRSGGDWETQVSKYNSEMSTVVFSCYFKKLNDDITYIMEDPLRTSVPTPSATTNKGVDMTIIVRGYPRVGFYGSQKGKNAIFIWNDDGGLQPYKLSVGRGGSFRYSNETSMEMRYTSAVGYDSYYDPVYDYGKDLSSSQYGVIGTLVGDNVGDFQPGIIAPVASGYLNCTSATDYTFPFAATTGHTLSAVGGRLSLSSSWAPDENTGYYGFVFSGPGLKYDCGVFSGTNGGDATASRDLAAYGYTDPFCKNGWYRAWVAADVPEDFYETSIYARASPEDGGAFHERNIFVACNPEAGPASLAGITLADYRAGIQGNTGYYYEVPLVCSGQVMAWEQYESYNKTSPFLKGHSSGYMPRPFQPRPYSWFTPRGDAFTDPTATSSITMSFT